MVKTYEMKVPWKITCVRSEDNKRECRVTEDGQDVRTHIVDEIILKNTQPIAPQYHIGKSVDLESGEDFDVLVGGLSLDELTL